MEAIKFDKEFLQDFGRSSKKEFIETNNIGMYASTSLCGVNTRKYHGLLVARQPQLDHHSYVLVYFYLYLHEMDYFTSILTKCLHLLHASSHDMHCMQWTSMQLGLVSLSYIVLNQP